MQPAAVLSILVKAQGVQAATGQLRGVDAAGRKASAGLKTMDTQTRRTSGTVSKLGSAARTAGLLVGAIGLAKGLGLAVDEYREAQKVGGQTNAVLKSTGRQANVTRKHIENLAGAISRKVGIDDEAIQSGENLLLTFTKIRNETGKGNKIFDRATHVITDMSVALGQDMKSSAIQVGKALNDPIKGITALRRVGVSFTEQQEDQIKKMVQSGDLLGAQRRILKELTSEFGGSAAAQATAGDKLKVSLGNLAEAAGGILVPALDKAAVALTNVIDQFVEGKGIAQYVIPAFNAVTHAAGGLKAGIEAAFDPSQGIESGAAWQSAGLLIGQAFKAIGTALQTVVTTTPTVIAAVRTAVSAVVSAFNAAKDTISSVVSAVTAEVGKWKVAFAVFGVIAAIVKVNIGIVVTVVKAGLSLLTPMFTATFGVIKAVVTGAFAALKAIVQGGVQALHGVIQVFGGILKGDFSQIWEGIKNIFRGALAAVTGILRSQIGVVRDAGTALAKGLIGSFRAALNLAHELAESMRDLIAKAPGFALGVGKAIVQGIVNGIKSAAGSIGSAIGGAIKSVDPTGLSGDGLGKIPQLVPFKGSLMGARASMKPFAAVGAANGLSVSSGRRPGARTSSGNTSYHSTGEAVDLAGSPAGMMQTFKELRSRFGSRLAELIYTPGGAGIKDGSPYVYSGQVAADHFDHVHVAFDSGKPGVGDGIGKIKLDRIGQFMGDGTGKYSGQQLANLWVKAGGDPKIAGLMARIAMAESGGNPGAKNPSGATGLWQILGAMVKGNLTDPLVNARNAVAKYKSQGLGAWTASRGAWGKYVGHPGIKAGGKAAKAKAKVFSASNQFDLAMAQADIGIADAKRHKLGTRTVGKDFAKAAAILQKEQLVGARIRKVRAALKGKLSKSTRLRLTQELSQLVPQHAQLALDRRAALNGPEAAASVDVGGGLDTSGIGGAEGDPNQPLIDAINAAADAERAHTDAINALKDEVNKQNAIAASTLGIGLREAQRALADMISGQLGGYGGVAGRAMTAGAGTVVRY